MTRRTFEVTDTLVIHPMVLSQAYPHIIWPHEVGVDDPISEATILRFETIDAPKRCIAILRLFMKQGTGEPYLVMCQHLSDNVGPKMGATAFVWPATDVLARGEQTLANNALQRFLRHERAQRRGR